MSKSHYIYVSSKNRNSNEKIYNFNVYLKNPIVVDKNQGINCSVIGFSMLNTDYNLKGVYFKVDRVSLIDSSLTHYTYNIPDGNYSYLSLMEYLNQILTGKIKVEYLKHRNAYKFTNLDSTNYDYYIIPENANKYLGIYEEMILASYTNITKEGSYINLTNYSHIIIKSNLLDFEDNTQDNIDTNGLRSSSILFMIDKQDIPPFSLITYRNFDKSDNYSYNITNKQINIIDLHLYNEKGELLTQTDEYFLTLKITIFNKDNTIASPVSYLDDIRFLIMSMMFDKKKSYNRIE